MRKTRNRAAAKAKADENAVRFGRTKVARLAEAAQKDKMRAHFDQHKFEDE